MAANYTFVSYSRKQLYFAEALTLHLQKQNIECWFDLQQLDTGTDWSKKLQEGYNNCDRLILVASRSALASPYVAVEWETALKNGKEVILAVFEEVEIPEKLKGAPVFDFRGDFNNKLRQLISYLNGGPVCHNPIPSPNRLEIPKRMPPAIWLILVNLLLPALWIIVIPLISRGWLIPLSSQAVTIYFSALLVVAAYLFFFILPFMRRTQGYDRLRTAVIIAFFVQLALAFANIFMLSNISILPGINKFAALTALISAYVYIVSINRSAAVLRWFPAGAVPRKMRRRIHGHLLKENTKDTLRDTLTTESTPVSFFIHYDPADRPEVNKIEKTLAKYGHRKAVISAEAGKQILLVTNRTSGKLVEQISEQYGGEAIYILGSTIDFGDYLSRAGQFQWLDFRENDKRNIEMLGLSLHDLEAWKRESALEAAPTRFQEFDAPDMVHLLRYLGLVQAGGWVGLGFALLIWGGLSRFSDLIICLSFAAIMYWLSERTLFRKATLPVYFAAIFFSSIISNLMSGSGLSNWYAMLVPLAAAYPSAHSWFPAGAKPVPDAVGMDADKKIRNGARILAGVFAIISFISSLAMLNMLSMIR